MIKIGIVGLGKWGTHVVRNFYALESVAGITVYDLKRNRINTIKCVFPRVAVAPSFRDILNSDVDAVVIATYPWSTHYRLGKSVLNSGKHLWLEKPFTTSLRQARDLVAVAKKNKVQLHVDHTCMYAAPVNFIKEILDRNTLGDVHTICMARLNTSMSRENRDVLWDLGSHDLSLLFFWFGGSVYPRNATGLSVLRNAGKNQAFILYKTKSHITITIEVSFVNFEKKRLITIFGSKKTLVYNQLDELEPVKMYYSTNRAAARKIDIPALESPEPLLVEARHFISCVEKNSKSRTSGETALPVVELLELASRRADRAV